MPAWTIQRRRRIAQVWFGRAIAISLLLAGPLAGCRSKAGVRRPQAAPRDIPAVFLGTMGTRASFTGTDPTLIAGYGLVVGLRGTGGGPYPPPVEAQIERELALIDVGPSSRSWQGTPLDGMTPAQVLRMRDVAIVLVYAAVPPGLPKGARFDLYVLALPNSGTTSLEGGMLMQVDLTIGRPAVIGRAKATTIAQGLGELYINPYADPGREGERVTRTVARVLDGGVMTNPLGIGVVLDNPSPTGARMVVDAINSRFPRQPGDDDDAARGRGTKGNYQLVQISVPDRYVDAPGDFINLIRFMQVDYFFAQEYANRYVNALKTEFWLAQDLAWALEALGRPALPFVQPLYDSSEPVTQFYALRVGARLGDERTAVYLTDIAADESSEFRLEAIELMRDLNRPNVDMVLRELAGDDELRVRIAAYDVLVWRAEQVRISQALAAGSSGLRLTPEQVRTIRREASITMPPGMLQGIQRLAIGTTPSTRKPKFHVDIVPFGEPLIYVTQHGVPRIVLFGEHIELADEFLIHAWDGRLMFRRDGPTDGVHVYYELAGENGLPGPTVARDFMVKPDVIELLQFLAGKQQRRDPRPGLDLTYSETVGAVAAMLDGGGIEAAFATETDRLRAKLLAAAAVTRAPDRPDTDQPGLDDDFLGAGEAVTPTQRDSMVVP
ncbi:MAG: flagellar basal body P-ring protein FlgI, partial [Planctomycetes bacterium]|nr:flagellar basal body P-ring protein FlgI [Planctomycetota bacterium]